MNWNRIHWMIAAMIAIPVLVVFVIFIRLIGAISSIPVVVGNRIDIERLARKAVNRAVDVEIAHEFRDDLLYIMEEHVHRNEYDLDEFDRWGILRQIDEDREEAIENLQTGETILSFMGAILSIAIGAWTDIRFVGIGLTFVLILFSILVVLRVVVTDLLSYRSREVRNDSIELLLLKQGWNENQINHGTSLVLASVLLTASSSDWGYDKGMQIVHWFGTASNPVDNERYASENP